MAEELLSLRMLLVGGSAAEAALWAQGAGRAGVPIVFETADPQRPELPQGDTIDILVMDSTLPAATAASLVQSARGRHPAPLILLCGAREKPLGFDCILPRPATVEEARRLTDQCVRARLPNRTLIVDDSGTMRSIVRKILSACRFPLEIEERADGESALHDIRSGRFGLVFVDYNMPGFDGIDTLKEIRRQHPNIAVVLMTSSLDEALAERALAAGAFAFLKKPFYPADVDAVLERYYGFGG